MRSEDFVCVKHPPTSILQRGILRVCGALAVSHVPAFFPRETDLAGGRNLVGGCRRIVSPVEQARHVFFRFIGFEWTGKVSKW